MKENVQQQVAIKPEAPPQPESLRSQVSITTASKKKPLFILLLLVIALIVLGTVGYFGYLNYILKNYVATSPPVNIQLVSSPTPVPIKKYTNKLIITKLTNDEVDKFEVKNNNQYVIWTDLGNNSLKNCRDGDIAHLPCLSQVNLYDIKAKSISKISGKNDWITGLEIFKNTAIWEETTNQVAEDNYFKRSLYQIPTKTLTDITNEQGERISDTETSYSKETVTGSGGQTTVTSIYKLDLNNNTEIKILEVIKSSSSAYGILRDYDVSENYIYYVVDYNDQGMPSSTLYGKSIKNQESLEIAKLYGLSGGDVIYTASKNLVSYIEYASENEANRRVNAMYNLYLYNLDKKEKSLIATLNNSALVSPHIVDNYLIYHNFKDSNINIYNIDTEGTLKISYDSLLTNEYPEESGYQAEFKGNVSYFSFISEKNVYLVRIISGTTD